MTALNVRELERWLGHKRCCYDEGGARCAPCTVDEQAEQLLDLTRDLFQAYRLTDTCECELTGQCLWCRLTARGYDAGLLESLESTQ